MGGDVARADRQRRGGGGGAPHPPVNSRSPTSSVGAATWSRHTRALAVFAARSARRSAPPCVAGAVKASEKSAILPKPPRRSSTATSGDGGAASAGTSSTRPNRLPYLSTPPMSTVTRRLSRRASVKDLASAAMAASAGESSGRGAEAAPAPAAAAGPCRAVGPPGAFEAQDPPGPRGASVGAAAAAAGAAAGPGTRRHCTPAMPTLRTTKAPAASADSRGPRGLCPGSTSTRTREPLGTCSGAAGGG